MPVTGNHHRRRHHSWLQCPAYFANCSQFRVVTFLPDSLRIIMNKTKVFNGKTAKIWSNHTRRMISFCLRAISLRARSSFSREIRSSSNASRRRRSAITASVYHSMRISFFMINIMHFPNFFKEKSTPPRVVGWHCRTIAEVAGKSPHCAEYYEDDRRKSPNCFSGWHWESWHLYIYEIIIQKTDVHPKK